MADITKTVNLCLCASDDIGALFSKLTGQYASACNFISRYIFNNGFELKYTKVQKAVYREVRDRFGLKSQMSLSAIKTVVARYKTLKEQLAAKPYRYTDENGKYYSVPRTLEWLQKSVYFQRPQADLVYGRDYSFISGKTALSLNTLSGRVKVSFALPECFKTYFDGKWKFGTGKLVQLNGRWYFHVPLTGQASDVMDVLKPTHVVGIDRGLRFLAVSYDEKGKTMFFDGRNIMDKRDTFARTRAELQAKGTKSAKRKLKKLSGRENRWMSDINHQIVKTLIDNYGEDTLFVIEDLTGVSFNEANLSARTKNGRRQTRSWAFYQFEQYLTYKALEAGAAVIKVPAAYTSQRCPKCGRINKENRHHDKHEYVCDSCGYRSNDDRIGAMNLYVLGTMYVSGVENPCFKQPKVKAA